MILPLPDPMHYFSLGSIRLMTERLPTLTVSVYYRYDHIMHLNTETCLRHRVYICVPLASGGFDVVDHGSEGTMAPTRGVFDTYRC